VDLPGTHLIDLLEGAASVFPGNNSTVTALFVRRASSDLNTSIAMLPVCPAGNDPLARSLTSWADACDPATSITTIPRTNAFIADPPVLLSLRTRCTYKTRLLRCQ
jgi:hypothetical protein